MRRSKRDPRPASAPAFRGFLALSCLAAACSNPAPEASERVSSGTVLDALPSSVEHRTRVDFGGKVTLVGYDLEPGSSVPAGSTVTLRLYWRSEKPLSAGWRLFTHLGSAGRRLANLDQVGPLRQSTSLQPAKWEPGKIYVDEQSFSMPNEPEVTIFTGVWNEIRIERNFGDLARGADPTRESSSGRASENPAAVGLRLPLIGGLSDGENRAIVARLVRSP